MKKPARRPKRCITAESQGAVVIEPKTISEIGIVASAGEGAIISPASPPITKIIGIWLPRMACASHQDRDVALRAPVIARVGFLQGQAGLGHGRSATGRAAGSRPARAAGGRRGLTCRGRKRAVFVER
jgi:hypothetical protein